MVDVNLFQTRVSTGTIRKHYIPALLDRNGNLGFINDLTTFGTDTFNGPAIFNGTADFNNTTQLYWRNTIDPTNPAATDSFYINNPVTTPQNNKGNTIIGFNAGINFDPANVGFNTILGSGAGQNCTTGGCTILGYLACNSLTTGNAVALGSSALQNTQTSIQNTAIGQNSGKNISTGNGNITMGFFSGASITTGSNNIVLTTNGSNLSTGSRCVILSNGFTCPLTTASDCVCVGPGSGINGSTGDSNTYLGRQCGQLSSSGFTHSTALGADSKITASNSIQLGQNNTDDVITGRDLTITRNATIAGTNGMRYTGTLSSTGGTPRTLNTTVGLAIFTGIATIAAGANANVVINNSLVTASTVGMAVLQGGAFAAQSSPRVKTVTFGAGTITINIENESAATATGAATQLNIAFTLWQL